MRILNRIVGIEGLTVGGGVTSTVKLPINRRYHQLKWFTTIDGVAAAADSVIDRIRLKVNGKTIRDVSGTRLLAIPALNGITAVTGEISNHFSESWRADKVDEQLTAWDMFGETSFEVDLVLKTLDPAEVPGVAGVAIYDFGQTLIDGQVAKNIIFQLEQTKNATGGLNDFDNISYQSDRGPKPIQRILLFSGQTINSVEVSADDNKVYEVLKAQNARILADHGLVASAVEFPICFDFTERVDDALVVRKNLNVRFDSANAAAVTALIETRASGYI